MADAAPTVYKARADALLLRDSSAIGRRPRPEAAGHARKPLGLAIVDGPEDGPSRSRQDPESDALHPLVVRALAGIGEAERGQPATIQDLYEIAVDPALQAHFGGMDVVRERIGEARKEIADLKSAYRNEVAELRLALTEARCEVREMRAIQEQARAVSRGEQGITGPRGIPGPQGVAGPRGERGDAAARPVGFVVNTDEFSATLILSDGSPGPRLALRPLFESFAAQIASDDEG